MKDEEFPSFSEIRQKFENEAQQKDNKKCVDGTEGLSTLRQGNARNHLKTEEASEMHEGRWQNGDDIISNTHKGTASELNFNNQEDGLPNTPVELKCSRLRNILNELSEMSASSLPSSPVVQPRRKNQSKVAPRPYSEIEEVNSKPNEFGRTRQIPVPKVRTSLIKNKSTSDSMDNLKINDSRLSVNSMQDHPKKCFRANSTRSLPSMSRNKEPLLSENSCNSNDCFSEAENESDEAYEELRTCSSLPHSLTDEGSLLSDCSFTSESSDNNLAKQSPKTIYPTFTIDTPSSTKRLSDLSQEPIDEVDDFEDENYHFDKDETSENLYEEHIYEVPEDAKKQIISNKNVITDALLSELSIKINKKKLNRELNQTTSSLSSQKTNLNEMNENGDTLKCLTKKSSLNFKRNRIGYEEFKNQKPGFLRNKSIGDWIPSSSSSEETSPRESTISRASTAYISPEEFDDKLNLRSEENKALRSNYEKQQSVLSTISYLELTREEPQEQAFPFDNEPLYQFYQEDVQRRAELCLHADPDYIFDENEYRKSDCFGENYCRHGPNCQNVVCKSQVSAFDFIGTGPNRTLWCQLPQVISRNLHKTLSDKQKKLQEALFEILTSEVSYFKSLKVLVNHFVNCPEFSGKHPKILEQREIKDLFSNVKDIYNLSSKLLLEFEQLFQEDIFLYKICDVLYKYADTQFFSYIDYCKFQADQNKLLTELKQTRPEFSDVLSRLESHADCQLQPLNSFLMLPMQRITRYPLLVEAVYHQLTNGQDNNHQILKPCEKALAILNHVVQKCNEEARKVQQLKEIIEINRKLHFGNGIKSYPLISGSRYLVKSGQVLWLACDVPSKKTMKTLRWSKTATQLFLLSDVLILAKKKSSEQYSVFDYCSREMVEMRSLNYSAEFDVPISLPPNYKNLVQLILHSNSKGKTVEYTLSFLLESDKTRWIEAVSSPVSDDPNETIYQSWDCPQVQCIENYLAKQPDELSLEKTDVVNVTRKMKDGWYEGERIRDGVKGWFPSECVEEIINQHVIARNLRLRHRLLNMTGSFLEGQKRKSLSMSNLRH